MVIKNKVESDRERERETERDRERERCGDTKQSRI